MTRTIISGTTKDGIAVEVLQTGYYDEADVTINGQRVEVLSVSRLRDGGTTRYETDRGTLVLPRRLGDPDRTPIWKPAAE